MPKLEEMLASIDVRSAHVFAEDLRQYVPSPAAQAYINRLDNVRFKGRFDGFVSDFVANGDFETALGKLQSDLQLVLESNRGVPYYRGKLATQGFELGKLLAQEATLQRISVDGRVEGYGFDLASLDTRVDVKVAALGLLGYDYRNITLNGRISEKYVKGELLIDDAHAQAALQGEIDLRPSTDSLPRGVLNATGYVESVDLKALKLLPKEALVSSRFDIHTRGTSLEDLVGNAYITNTLLRYDGQEILMDSLRFFSSKKEGKRKGGAAFRFTECIC
ncbi:MAG: AsmA-like C-terminal region-containing protein [Saprospiraceae bacterium]|nr:AsmA-like C-terminal region-containing protein [Saprospiraceae bacterium]